MENTITPSESYSILHFIDELIFIIDEDWNCVFANREACAHFAISERASDFFKTNTRTADRVLIQKRLFASLRDSARYETLLSVDVQGLYMQYHACFTCPSNDRFCLILKKQPCDCTAPKQDLNSDIDPSFLADMEALSACVKDYEFEQAKHEHLLLSQKLLVQFASNITCHTASNKGIGEMLEEIGMHLKLDRISLTTGTAPNSEYHFWSSRNSNANVNIQKYFGKNTPDTVIASANRGWPDAAIGSDGTAPQGALLRVSLYNSKGCSGHLQAEKFSADADWTESEIQFLHEIKKIFETIFGLIESNTELIEAKELAEIANLAKSEFLANISHEIRTPLNAMLGYSQAILEKKGDPENKFAAASIIKNGSALLDLINDIIELSKIEAGITEYPLAFTSIRDLFGRLELLFSSTAETKSIIYTLQYDREMPNNLLINTLMTKQILVNLIGNAFKFTPAGSVTVSAWSTHKDNKELGDLYIEIKDTGIGIAEKTISHIFEPFFQNEPVNTKSFSGVGLGLTVVKKLLNKIGGSIEVSSTVGVGSSFVVCIPDVLGNNSPETQDELNETIANFRKSTPEIIIVSDRESLAHFVRNFFTESGNISQLSGNFIYDDIPFDAADVIIVDRLSPCSQATELMLMKWKSRAPDCTPVCIAVSTPDISAKLMYDGYFWLPLKQKQIHKELVRLANMIKRVEIRRDEQFCESNRCPINAESMLYSELQSEAMPIVKSLSEGIILNDVDKLVAVLCGLGNKYQSHWCLQTGLQLSDALQAFDLFRIDSVIAEFEKGMNQAL